MEVDDGSEARVEEKGKRLVVLLVGAPGSGKSTFCDAVVGASRRPWVRICQDTIGNGKAGTKAQCVKSALSALKDGKSVFIDRCNLDREQRAEFLKLGSAQIDVHAMVLDLPTQLCISRSVKRTGHEGNLQGGKAAAVVNRMLQKKELPKLSEGFSRITFCHNDAEVQAALGAYSGLGPSDGLPPGCFGQKSQDAKVQVGIMKFLKKAEGPSPVVSKVNSNQSVASIGSSEKKDSSLEREQMPILPNAPQKEESKGKEDAVQAIDNDVCTLAFPSISTADFQFNLEKASDIIVETVEEFVPKLGNARLVLVDLTYESKILSLVRAKAAKKSIDSSKFFTFAGNIIELSTKGGLNCNVIANAANWRLKPGGGGVNAAIFKAAGADLEKATNERVKSLLPGSAVVVPLPSTSPLYNREGITHVIHVLGPNMNPQRPNCLNNDYNKGCMVLRQAYTSLFEGFLSLLKLQEKSVTKRHEEFLHHSGHGPDKNVGNGDLKNKRDDADVSISSKKSRGSGDEVETHITRPRTGNSDSGTQTTNSGMTKAWGSWAQALYHIAMNPERHKDDILEILEDVVVLNDAYPKAQKHILILAQARGLDCLADVHEVHLELLRRMHAIGLKWVEKFLHEDSQLVFRLGYHSAPSMRQLHLHVISQDFNSVHLKNKKHWNSFNTAFFRDSVDVIEEVNKNGKAMIKDDESLLSMELRCHRCRSAHPNIPRLKSHIQNCQVPFPSFLLQSDRLVRAPDSN